VNHTDVLLRSTGLGLATGARTSLGLTALALTASPRRPPLALLATLASGAELVVDKLPSTTSRLQPPGLVVRLVSGAVVGVLIARRRTPAPQLRVVPEEPEPTPAPVIADARRTALRVILPAALGSAAAYAGTRAGAAARAAWQGWPAAVLEDVLSSGLAAWSVR
jgi:uncharacterized membrane protein